MENLSHVVTFIKLIDEGKIFAYNVTYFNLVLTIFQSLVIKTLTILLGNSFEICQKCSSPKNNKTTSCHNNVSLLYVAKVCIVEIVLNKI